MSTNGNSAHLDLKSLLQESQRLTNHISSTSSLPALTKSLPLIQSSSARLLSSLGPSSGSQQQQQGLEPLLDPRTTYLLAKQGFDPEQLTSTLNDIQLATTFEPLEPVLDTDLDAFLRNEHDNMISCLVQEVRSKALKDAMSNFENKLKADWALERRAAFEELVGINQQSACKLSLAAYLHHFNISSQNSV